MTLDPMTMIDDADEKAGFVCLETVQSGLPLRRLAVNGRITGLLYRLSVAQTFVNVHAEPLEATYIFSLPARRWRRFWWRNRGLAMEPHDSFRDAPWDIQPTEDWSQPSYWADHYRELLAEQDPVDRDLLTYPQVYLLVWMLLEAGELPRSSPQTVTDAGCGITIIPHLLASWGFHVTAIDYSAQAIEWASALQPTPDELATYPIPFFSEQREHFPAPGGSVSYLVGDWLTADLPPSGVVICRNGLRGATKPNWRRSLLRFHDLLVPGGVLLLETQNALAIQGEVEDLLDECGFTRLVAGVERDPSVRYRIDFWPTG